MTGVIKRGRERAAPQPASTNSTNTPVIDDQYTPSFAKPTIYHRSVYASMCPENKAGVAEIRNPGRDPTRRRSNRVEPGMSNQTEAVIGLRPGAQESMWREPPALHQNNEIIDYLSWRMEYNDVSPQGTRGGTAPTMRGGEHSSPDRIPNHVSSGLSLATTTCAPIHQKNHRKKEWAPHCICRVTFRCRRNPVLPSSQRGATRGRG